MKRKSCLALLMSVLLVCTLLTGCGGADKNTSAAQAVPREEAYDMSADMGGGANLTTGSTSGSTALPENRKWIITVRMDAETDDLDAMMAALDEKITQLGGYVEDQSIYNGSAYGGGTRYRSADLTVRIPAADVDKFTQAVSGIANVVRNDKDLDDITLNYVSTESRINALTTEEARLLELLAKAENMSDLLEIEARLTDVRYELENYASQLRLYDNQIDYATIYLDIEEVREYTPIEEPTLWERIRDGFLGSLAALGEGLVDLLVFVIVSSPFLLVYGGFVALVIVIVKKIQKKRQAKKPPFPPYTPPQPPQPGK